MTDMTGPGYERRPPCRCTLVPADAPLHPSPRPQPRPSPEKADTMDIWITLIEDRHADVDALPFSSAAAAIEAARGNAPDDAEPEILNNAMLKDGWVFYLPYGTEGDCVRVVKRTMDGG